MKPERVILWGFMASGKSAVGVDLARRLGWDFLDLDEEIERRDGRSVPEIFRADGEPYFRRLEVETTRAVIGRSALVFSCGGGWVTNPESAQLVPPASLTVWLKVSPETALARIRTDREGRPRPMIDTPDPDTTARRLLAAREPLYRRADLTLSTEGRTVRSIAEEIEAWVRTPAPTPPESPHTKDHADEG